MITRSEKFVGGYCLRTNQWIPAPLDQVFSFFSDAHQLERLTPAWLKFKIVTPDPIELRAGCLIDYRLRLHGLPVTWQSEITAWEPPHRFCDEQRRGPYRHWIHEHRFAEEREGTRVFDEVEYAVPGGRLIHGLLVRRDVVRIFEFRRQTLERIFSTENS